VRAARARLERERLLPFAAAALGGACYFLGYIGHGLWPCILVFLVPFWWALDRLHGGRVRDSLAAGLVFGAVAYAGGFPWLWRVVDAFLDGNVLAGAVLWLGFGMWFALGFAVYALLFRAVRRRGWPVALAGVPTLLLVEWLQPQIFPLYAGGVVVFAPLWAQTADLGGPLALTLLVAIANLVVFETWEWGRGRRRRPVTTWTAAFALAVVVVTYGVWRVAAMDATVRTAPALTVGLVQANLGVAETRTATVLSHRRYLEQTRGLLQGGTVDLVIWPESAYGIGISRPLPVSGAPIRGDITTPLLFGGSSVEQRDGRRAKTNSAFLVGADGMIREVYDKNLLIPLAEYLPVVDALPALADWFPHASDFRAAHDTPALRLGEWRIATPICYEAIRPDFVRRMAASARPHLFVTIANDGWFGDSHEPWLHLALARLRAIEHRRYVVRATNTGVSAIIDPSGRLIATTDLLARANLRGVVRPLEGETVYARVGDWIGWASAAVVALAAFTRRRGATSFPHHSDADTVAASS
jgi:apolipoprotein N-acyltransferase